MLNCNNCQISD